MEIDWEAYASLQRRADRDKIDALTWAFEEQATEFLNSQIDGNVSSIDPAKRRKTINNLAINRRKKHRHREILLQRNAGVFNTTIPSPESTVIARWTLEVFRNLTTDREWEILQQLANGDDYKAIALAQHLTLGAVKSVISRCRTRLKTKAGP